MDQGDLPWVKLTQRPLLARELVIGQYADMELFHFPEELRGITLAVEDDTEAAESGSAASAWALGWSGASDTSRGTMSSRSAPNKPGSTARLTTKNGRPSMALTQ